MDTYKYHYAWSCGCYLRQTVREQRAGRSEAISGLACPVHSGAWDPPRHTQPTISATAADWGLDLQAAIVTEAG